jgi:hypothetical protein
MDDSELVADLRARMCWLRSSEAYSDLVLVDKGGRRHPCHRAIMCTLSENIRVVVHDGCTEAEAGTVPQLWLSKMSHSSVEAVLDFAYSSSTM